MRCVRRVGDCAVPSICRSSGRCFDPYGKGPMNMGINGPNKLERALNEVHCNKDSVRRVITNMCRQQCPDISLGEIDKLVETIHQNYVVSVTKIVSEREPIKY